MFVYHQGAAMVREAKVRGKGPEVEARARAADQETLVFEWDDPLFQLPIPVSVNGDIRVVEMTGGKGSTEIPVGAKIEVDPQGWLLALPAKGSAGATPEK